MTSAGMQNSVRLKRPGPVCVRGECSAVSGVWGNQQTAAPPPSLLVKIDFWDSVRHIEKRLQNKLFRNENGWVQMHDSKKYEHWLTINLRNCHVWPWACLTTLARVMVTSATIDDLFIGCHLSVSLHNMQFCAAGKIASRNERNRLLYRLNRRCIAFLIIKEELICTSVWRSVYKLTRIWRTVLT